MGCVLASGTSGHLLKLEVGRSLQGEWVRSRGDLDVTTTLLFYIFFKYVSKDRLPHTLHTSHYTFHITKYQNVSRYYHGIFYTIHTTQVTYNKMPWEMCIKVSWDGIIMALWTCTSVQKMCKNSIYCSVAFYLK